MESKKLKQHVSTLINLPVTDAPLISCYQSVTEGRLADSSAFTQRMRVLRQGLSKTQRPDFDTALARIDEFVSTELSPDARGIAVFSRAGEEPFLLPLQFRVPLPNWVAVDATPNIYHLIELKDTYDRYVVMIATERSVRIVQVNLGAVTAQMWQHRPELRERVGREWTKSHFQKHLNERNRRFVKDTIKVLEQLMSAGKYFHLILAGHASITSQVRRELPKNLVEKLVDTVSAPGTASLNDVVQATLASFVKAEEAESRATLAELLHQLRTGGLAVVGTLASFRAIQRGQTDVLVLAKQYAPGTGWSCKKCGHMVAESAFPVSCPDCGARVFREFDIKEQIVRKAEEFGCLVEVVRQSDELDQLGGIGCLLRYREPDDYL